jgi:hypothetical protein
MAPRSRSRSSAAAAPEARRDLTLRLQILGAVVVPMLLIGVWLASKGFFSAP